MNDKLLAEMTDALNTAYSVIEKVLLKLSALKEDIVITDVLPVAITRKDLQTLCLDLVRKDRKYSDAIKALMVKYNAKVLSEVKDADMVNLNNDLVGLQND
jgi:hypothetical protein